MSVETEVTRLTKENELLRKIIETQEHTIKRLIDHFILEKREMHKTQA